MRILITGYAGFIGSNLARMLLSDEHDIVGVDCLTYAARPDHIRQALRQKDSRLIEMNCDIRDDEKLRKIISSFKPEQVYHLAAESHVCRSIEGPRDFATTNFMGTFNLLEALRKSEFKGRLVHISTDEAFGELEDGEAPFHESRHIDPRSPYAASKAASDLMVRSYHYTYGLDAIVTRCTNNYGPNQHEEKLIPRAITRFLQKQSMTLYGDGSHRRDWIHVDDHCRGLIAAMTKGKSGELYCFGSGLELSNKEVVQRVHIAVEAVAGPRGFLHVDFTDDRPTDDKRYAVDSFKAKRMLGWGVDSGPAYFSAKLKETVRWYLERQ